MRKITTSPIVCDKCGSVLKSEQHDFFCDQCKEKISSDKYRSGELYSLDIFWKSNSVQRCSDKIDFCSIKCMKEWLRNFPYNKNEVEFITLPYIHNIDDLNELFNDIDKE